MITEKHKERPLRPGTKITSLTLPDRKAFQFVGDHFCINIERASAFMRIANRKEIVGVYLSEFFRDCHLGQFFKTQKKATVVESEKDFQAFKDYVVLNGLGVLGKKNKRRDKTMTIKQDTIKKSTGCVRDEMEVRKFRIDKIKNSKWRIKVWHTATNLDEVYYTDFPHPSLMKDNKLLHVYKVSPKKKGGPCEYTYNPDDLVRSGLTAEEKFAEPMKGFDFSNYCSYVVWENRETGKIYQPLRVDVTGHNSGSDGSFGLDFLIKSEDFPGFSHETKGE